VIPWRAPSGDGIRQRGNGSDEPDVPACDGSPPNNAFHPTGMVAW
jgi:hypothetical protein